MNGVHATPLAKPEKSWLLAGELGPELPLWPFAGAKPHHYIGDSYARIAP